MYRSIICILIIFISTVIAGWSSSPLQKQDNNVSKPLVATPQAPEPRKLPQWKFAQNTPMSFRGFWKKTTLNTPALAQLIFSDIASDTGISLRKRTMCGTSSCTLPYVRGDNLLYQLALAEKDYRRGEISRFVALHELGHVVDFEGISRLDKQRFMRLFAKSPHWKRCFRYQNTCIKQEEIMAEQFALWATRKNNSLTYYKMPRLANFAAYEKLLQATYDRDLDMAESY